VPWVVVGVACVVVAAVFGLDVLDEDAAVVPRDKKLNRYKIDHSDN
jgi:hypothetical protein